MTLFKLYLKALPVLLVLLLAGCLGMPKSVTPIQTFDVNEYLGTWYEIARLDHSFERGLTHVTATYSFKEDGGVKSLTVVIQHKRANGSKRKAKPILLTNPMKAT